MSTEWKTRYLAEKANAEAWREMAMKLADALKQPAPVLAAAPITKRKKSGIADAIQRESGGDPRLAGYLRKRASKLKKEGKTEADIIEVLGQWSTTEQDS